MSLSAVVALLKFCPLKLRSQLLNLSWTMTSFLAFKVALDFAHAILGSRSVSIGDGAEASAGAEPKLPGSV